MRQHVFRERVAAAPVDRLAVGGGYGLGGHAERQSRNVESPQGIAGDVNSLPERRGPEQDGASGGPEPSEQRVPAVLAVNEKRPASLDAARPQLGRRSFTSRWR